jgi:hypothetical protein
VDLYTDLSKAGINKSNLVPMRVPVKHDDGKTTFAIRYVSIEANEDIVNRGVRK